MELHAAKLELFEHFANVGRAVGSGPRLLLLDLLAQGEKTVEVLSRQAGLTVGNTSAHLKGLKQVSLVSIRKVVVAAESSVLLSFGDDLFREFLLRYPTVMMELLQTAVRRLHRVERRRG